jgi:hypothetical protein
MTPLDTLASGIKHVDSLLEDHVLEPDVDRVPSDTMKARVREVRDALDRRVLDALDETLEDAQDDEVRTIVKRRVAGLLATVAAVAHASRDDAGAAKLRARAAELAPDDEQKAELHAGDAEPRAFTRLQHARWLFFQKRRADADRVAKVVAAETKEPALRAGAQEILRAPRPIQSAPSLFTLNGFGTGLYGKRDERDDGWYIATYCICALFIPVFPITAYRVRHAGGNSYQFVAREALSPLARAWQLAVVAAVVLGIGWGGVSSYLASPARKAKVALEEAQKIEARGDREGALERYTALLREHGTLAEAAPAAESVIRLAAANVPEPCTADAVDKVAKVADAFQSIPPAARAAAAKAFVQRLTNWSAQIGDASAEHVDAALTVLDMAAKVATAGQGTGDAEAIDKRRSELRRTLASKVVAARPLHALALYARPPAEAASLGAARDILQTFGTAPSLWIEAEHDVRAWADAAEKQPVLRAAAQEARQSVDAALAARAAEAALLESGDEKQLAAALARTPFDQDLAAALAQIQRRKGDVKAALATLGALGTPGRMTALAQQLFAMCHAENGDLAGADRILSDLLAERLPAFQEAQREFSGAAERAEAQIVADAKAGHIPPDLRRKVEAATSDDEGRTLFRNWLSEQLAADPLLASLRKEFLRHEAVVPASLGLGQIKLRRAAAASGHERTDLLAAAEKVFLSIHNQAEGDPSYHLGLGQVYHRLGRTDEGNAELSRVLARKDPELTLGVAQVYRELGLAVRAKQVTEQLYASTTEDRWKKEAAALMSHLVGEVGGNEEEIESWLKRGDTSSSEVKQLLLNLEARRLRRQGKLAEADQAFARLAGGYERDAAHNASAANNAAIAYQERYGATGDPAHLRAAAKQLELAHRLAPASALIAGNLSDALQQLASVAVLDRWIKTRTLALDVSETQAVLATLMSGPLHDEAVAALRKEVAFQRSLDVAAEEQVLSPQKSEGYDRPLRWLLWSRDEAGLEALAARVAGMPPFDASARAEGRRMRLDKSRDAQTKAHLAQTVSRASETVRKAERAGHAPTQAAAEAVLTWALAGMAIVDPSVENLDAMVASARRAAQGWADGGMDGGLPAVLALAGVYRAAADDVAVRTVVERDARLYDVTMLLARVADEGEAGLSALRRRPEIVEAGRLAKAQMRKSPGLFDVVIARVVGDADMAQAAAAAFDNKRIGAHLAIEAAMAPGQEPERYELDFFRRRGK